MWCPPPRKFLLSVEERHAEASKRSSLQLAAFAKMIEGCSGSEIVMQGPGGCSGFLQVAFTMWQEALRQVEAECVIVPEVVAFGYGNPHGVEGRDLRSLGIDPRGPRYATMYPVPHRFISTDSGHAAPCTICGGLEEDIKHRIPVASVTKIRHTGAHKFDASDAGSIGSNGCCAHCGEYEDHAIHEVSG